MTTLALVAVALTANAETRQVQGADTNKPSAARNSNRGVVLDVIESPMYTYVQVSCDTGEVWLAANKNIAGIAKGDSISYPNGVVMRNFYSKSLNRSVAKIIFVNNVELEGK
jgi:hypothetical protein